jgi:hypothetical protein
MRVPRGRLALLAMLVLGLAIVVVIRDGGDGPAGTTPRPSNPAGRTDAASGDVETDVKLELLDVNRDVLTEAARNPFRFEAKTPPPAPPRAPSDDGPVVFTPPPAPTGPPPPPPIPLRYFGLAAGQDGVPIAFFNDGRGNVFQGKEGDIIEGRYKLLRVGTDSVELAYLDGRGRQTIRLSGQ